MQKPQINQIGKDMADNQRSRKRHMHLLKEALEKEIYE
jgi:hypothetical protein